MSTSTRLDCLPISIQKSIAKTFDGCRNVNALAHFLTFGIVVKKFIVAVPFARRTASILESDGKFLV